MARRYFITDREAYAERVAIMLEGQGPEETFATMEPYRTAGDAAYQTRFAVVASAAANGDWEPAREWCRQERDRFGDDLARELMRDIQRTVEDEKKLKG